MLYKFKQKLIVYIYLQMIRSLLLFVFIVSLVCSQIIEFDQIKQPKLSKDFKPNEGYIPCSKKDFCGDNVKAFRNTEQFNSFLDKSKTPILLKMSDSTPIYKSTAPSAVSAEFSHTNNQVENVDEADIIKNDGNYIYTISKNYFTIVKSFPLNDTDLVFSDTFAYFVLVKQILIENNSVIVFGYVSQWKQTIGIIYNTTDKNKVTPLTQISVSGEYFAARKLQNGFIYVITKHDFRYNKNTYIKINYFSRIDIDPSSIFYYDQAGTYKNLKGFNIFTLNLKNPIADPRKKAVTVCSEDASVLYMSANYIYIASNKTINNELYTQIRKIFVREDKIIPHASSTIQGTVRNQFSLDQYDDFLRVVTTVSNISNSTDYKHTNVFVLSYDLQIYGKLQKLTPLEMVYSSRYIGKRLYLVTFRKVDPFLVISFQNHAKPQQLGHIKLPGFSTYLHPFDQYNILAIGRNINDSSFYHSVFDVVITLFNVTNLKEIKVAYRVELKQFESISLSQHKSVLFDSVRKMLVIPVEKGKKFAALVLNLSETKLESNYLISHNQPIERSLTIENLLYTKSECLIKVSEINNSFALSKELPIKCK